MNSRADGNTKQAWDEVIRELVAKGDVSKDVLSDSDSIIRWWRNLDLAKQDEITRRVQELSQSQEVVSSGAEEERHHKENDTEDALAEISQQESQPKEQEEAKKEQDEKPRKRIRIGWVVLVVICIIILVGNAIISGNDNEQPSSTATPSALQKPAVVEEHFITFSTAIDGNRLIVHGETNLPDGSWLAVHVEKITTESTTGVTAHSATVEGGKFSDTVVLYRDSGQLSVTVIFSPLRFPQPSSVIASVGENGEKLKGSQVKPVEHLGETFYTLSANKILIAGGQDANE